MAVDVDIDVIGAALSNPARAAMLLALLGGDALTAGELADIAGRSPSAASVHLRMLRDAGLAITYASGRHRLFRLASAEVAEALEALQRIAPPRPARTLSQSAALGALRRARTCYDHLAGELGVAVTDRLLVLEILEWVDGGFRLTTNGDAWFRGIDVDIEQIAQQRRALTRACVDWTERRPHLAGALGAGLTDVFFARRLVRRLPGGRAILVSKAGHSWLERNLGLSLE